MSIIKMEPIVGIRPRTNQWMNSHIQPGNVGSVGSVNLQPKFKHSNPDMPLRFDPYFAHQNEVFLGANIQNGQSISYVSGGGPARTIDSNWGGRRDFKTAHGTVYQDLRASDKLHEPRTGETPHYGWNNRIATTYQSLRTGDKFLPSGGYAPGLFETPRGGQTPLVVAVQNGAKPVENGIVQSVVTK
jgi:hypothetical protein